MLVFFLQVNASVPQHLTEEVLIFLGHPILVNTIEMDSWPRTDGKPLNETGGGGRWTQFVMDSRGCYGLQVSGKDRLPVS